MLKVNVIEFYSTDADHKVLDYEDFPGTFISEHSIRMIKPTDYYITTTVQTDDGFTMEEEGVKLPIYDFFFIGSDYEVHVLNPNLPHIVNKIDSANGR